MPIVELKVNGTAHRLEVEPEQTLLGVLRDQLGLTGAKYGCGEGQCGACTVLVDGRAARSCQARVAAVAGASVTTIEGLAAGRPAASGAGGVPRRRRDAVRLLHAGHDPGRGRPCSPARREPTRRRRSRAGSRATSAAAAPTRASCRAVGQAARARRRPRERGRDPDGPFEPERYELAEGPAYRFEVDRREFVKAHRRPAWSSGWPRTPRRRSPGAAGAARTHPQDIAAWLHRARTASSPSTRARSSSARTSAPRWPRPWPRSCARRSPASAWSWATPTCTPFDMGTFGSRTTPIMAMQLRRRWPRPRARRCSTSPPRTGRSRARRCRSRTAACSERGGRSTRRSARSLAGRKLVRKAGDAARRPRPIGVDDRRPFRPQGQRPRHGHRRAPVHLGPEPARHVVRQGAAAAHRRSDAPVRRRRGRRGRRARRWSATAPSSASRRPPRSPRGALWSDVQARSGSRPPASLRARRSTTT